MPMETDRLKLPLPLGNENVTRESINAIFEKIDAGVATQEELHKAVSEMDIPDASLTQKGKVQLSSKTNGTSETLAATEKAVNVAFAEAQSAKQLGVEQKANVVAALNSIGVAASTSESWAQLITKMASVIRATGNATVGQVLAGATFSNATRNGLVGTMPNRSAQSAHQLAKLTEVWVGDRAFMMPPDGYYDGQSWVYALTPDLRPENILLGKNILGVVGSYAPNEVQTLAGSMGKNGTTNGANFDTFITNVPSNKLTVMTSVAGMVLEVVTGPYPDNMARTLIVLKDNAGNEMWVFNDILIGADLSRWSYVLKVVIDPINRRARVCSYNNTDTTIRGTSWTAFPASLSTNGLQLFHRAIVNGTDSYRGRAMMSYPDESTWLLKF
ncbi:phage tail protein [Paenibacillus sp. JJ-223]|uniref:tail fiber protein n=1 Tax=Paenibacillus sp. JJ-223 TaxID=2905647 RepID=UPI001F3881EC|nr:phage tail protein [Paenibacillus sp. JJ-223]CAH1203923.1 hypothetical protein PAECIP111890_02399 [Paenibacillus sp. JJ-223]